MRKFITLAACLAATVAFAVVSDIRPIVEPYLGIQQALAADRIEGIADAARRIGDEAGKLGSDASAIQAAAGDLQQATDLKTARAAFGRLGDAIMIFAKASGASVGADVKVAYCPMARKYWLQTDDEIRNPFYGKAMSDCGRFNAGLPDIKK